MTEKQPLLGAGLRDERRESPARRSFGGLTRAAFLVRLRRLACLVVLFGFITTVYKLDYQRHHLTTPAKLDADLCLTPACVHASSEILYSLSPDYENVDPCTDFEELVCGGWKEHHDLRPDQGDVFTGTIMHENSQLLLRHILEADYPKDSKHSYFSPMQLDVTVRSSDEENFKLMKDAYDACADQETIKKHGVKPLVKILDEIKDLFSQSNSRPPVKDALLLLANYGVGAFAIAGTGADEKNPDNVVVAVYPPWRIGLPSKERYKDDALVAKYQDVLVKVLSALYPDQDTGSFKGVVELEKKLAAASPPIEDLQDVTKIYNPMSLPEADDLAPVLGLADIVSSLSPAGETPSFVIVAAPEYMKAVGEIIAETPSDVVHNYFFWKTIQSFASYVEAEEIKPYRQFLNELAGKDPDSEPERWRTCVSHVDSGVGWVLSRFFVEKAFSAKAKAFGDRIVLDIKDEFVKKLKAAEWMEDSSTKLAIEKVHNIDQKIGYPTASPDIMDPDSLAKYYEGLKLSPEKFFDNVVNMRQLELRKEWDDLGKPVDRAKWGLSVPTVNAYYNPPGNEIVFPAGIMQFPVFDVNVPAYLSYGAFGAVAGHELSHAFDSTGRHFDQNGNYTDWWTDATVKAFEEKTQCFIDQYSSFTVPGPDDKPLHVNGKLTLGENIADAGGLSASFQAWQRRAAETPNEDLPGLDFFTQDQLFFVSYANWWCGKSRKDTAINRIYTDPHAPKWARILGTMANSKEFKESFQCKDKKPTCELW